MGVTRTMRRSLAASVAIVALGPAASASAAPTCVEQPTVVVAWDATATITLQCTDPDPGALTYVISEPPKGQLTPDVPPGGASWTYTPKPGETTDQFTYRATGAAEPSPPYTQQITITQPPNTPPEARIQAPSTAHRGESVTFTSTSVDDVGVASHAWTIDGVASTEATVQRTFDTLGEKPVSLTVTDDLGLTHTATSTIEIVNRPPTDALIGGPDQGYRKLGLQLGAAAQDGDGQGTLVRYEWDLDGLPGYERDGGSAFTTTVTFATIGLKTVGVRITDDDDDTVTATKTIRIDNQLPSAAIVDPVDPTAGRPVTLVGSGLDLDGDALRWAWDLDNDGAFDDGIAARATRGFPAGTHTVRLRVTDGQGGTAVAVRRFVVRAAQPSAPPDTRQPGLVVTPLRGQKLRRVRARGLRLTVRCDEPCTAYFELVIDPATARKLKINRRARAPVRIARVLRPAGARTTMAVKLTSKAARAFRKARKVKVVLQGSAWDAAGNATLYAPRTLTLKR